MYFLFLCVVNLFSIYWGPNPLSKEPNLTWVRLLIAGAQFVLLTPIIEECVFRAGLPMLIENDLWVNLLFGAAHIVNYCHTKSIGLIGRQMVITFFFGLYLSELKFLDQSIFLHMVYNLIGFVGAIVMSDSNPKVETLDFGYRVWHVRLNRSKSCSDLRSAKKPYNKTKYVNLDSVPEGIIKSQILRFQSHQWNWRLHHPGNLMPKSNSTVYAL